jgi:hypothetical protein
MTSDEVVFRPATAADVEAFYGHPPVTRMHAIVALREGVPVMIGGISWVDGAPIVFSSLKDEARKHRKWIAKGIRIVMDFADRFQMPALYAIANPNEPTAPYLLAKLGFRPSGVMTNLGEYMVREAA